MSTQGKAEKLAVRRAYDHENVTLAPEATPTRNLKEDEAVHPEKEEAKIEYTQYLTKLLAGEDIPLWRRVMGPGRHLVTDIESIFPHDEASDTTKQSSSDKPPKRWEIMKSWVEDSEGTEPNFFLSIVSKSKTQEMFLPDDVEWIHQKESIKTHSKFKRLFTSYGLEGLIEGVDRITLGLLKRVQINEERTFQGGFYLNPCVLRYDGKGPDQTDSHTGSRLDPKDDYEYRPCTFLNFPYFALENISAAPESPDRSRELDAPDHPYPVRTLLQTRYRLEPTGERDRIQAVTMLTKREVSTCIRPSNARLVPNSAQHTMANAKCTKILHVPQLWCLSISGEKLITSAPMSELELYGNSIKTKTITTKSRAGQPGDSIIRIIFDDEDIKKSYVHPINHCDWWFGLLDKLQQIGREHELEGPYLEKFELYLQDGNNAQLVITDQNWVAILQSQSKLREIQILMIKKSSILNQDQVPEKTTSPPLDQNTSKKELNPPAIRVSGDVDHEDNSRLHPDVSDIDGLQSTKQFQPSGVHDFAQLKLKLVEDLEKDKRIPLFEWRLRKYSKHPREDDRSERLKYVISQLRHDFMHQYSEWFKEKYKCTPHDTDSLSEIEDIEGRSLAQWNHDRERKRLQLCNEKGTKDERWVQIEALIADSSEVLGSFLPVELLFGQSSDPEHNLELNKIGNDNIKVETFILHREASAEEIMLNNCRGILGAITSFIRGAAMTPEELKYVRESFKQIIVPLNELHIGVFTLRACNDGNSGVNILQRVVMDAFKHAVFFHVGLCNYLWQRPQPGQDPSGRSLAECLDTHVKSCSKALKVAQANMIAEAADVEEIPDLGPIVTTEAVIIMLLDRLSKGVHSRGSIDVIELYERVLEKLAIKVEDIASRDLLVTLNRTAEELDIVGEVLKHQEKVLSLLRVLLDPNTFKNPQGREKKFKYESRAIDSILKATRQSMSDCEELKFRITRLTTQNVQLIETQNDANNTAILVFTIVTIIFLPLSFVSGFLGMNVQGIANTTYGVDHFWKIGVPLTVGIVLPCLIVAFWYTIKKYTKRIQRHRKRSKAKKS